MRKLSISVIAASLVLALSACNKSNQDVPVSEGADLVVYGNVYTAEYSADGKSATAEAIAIKDGKYIYVGNADGVSGYISDKTEIIECSESRMVLPGLTDGHAHYILDALIDVFEEDGLYGHYEYPRGVGQLF